MPKKIFHLLFFILLTILPLHLTFAYNGAPNDLYLPYFVGPETPPPPEPFYEIRGLWVTRFDWTAYNQPADPAKIDEIVANASAAGFNMIFFQVRGTADSYYTPGLEPWAQRVSGGTIGDAPNPAWDPLAYFVEKAHAANIQLHAYINVYPVWDKCDPNILPPENLTPPHFYYTLQQIHGTSTPSGATQPILNGVQWTTSDTVHCSVYVRTSPASIEADDHYIAIGSDLVARYAIDGIHLDNIRYGGSNASCDPISESRWGAPCFTAGYADWQRRQVNGTVRRFYQDVITPTQTAILSAAVWPIHIDKWGWGGLEGANDYYQDSKAWVADGYIDMISPMIYPGSFNCPDNSFWTQSRWETLVADFQAEGNGRFIVPGIGTGYCDFAEIANRIEAARTIGTVGHALFSYSSLKSKGYFTLLAEGPYAQPAVVPPIDWR